MRFLSRPKLTQPELKYKLLQIQSDSTAAQSGVVPFLLDEIWQACRTFPRAKWSGTLPPYVSLETRAKNSELVFYLWLPEALANHLNDRLTSAYPDLSFVESTDDYSEKLKSSQIVAGGELCLTDNELLPIISSDGHAQTNRWLAAQRLISQISFGDEAWVQILVRPIDNAWKHKIDKQIKKKLRGSRDDLSSAYMAKAAANGFSAKIRLVYVGRDRRTVSTSLKALAESYGHLNSLSPNGFKLKTTSLSRDRQLEYHVRLFIDKGYLLNTNELSSLIDITTSEVIAQPEPIVIKGKRKFEELLAKAEAKTFKAKPSVRKKIKSKPIKRSPRGVIEIATKVDAKKGIGKVATSKSQVEEQPGEVTIKLR